MARFDWQYELDRRSVAQKELAALTGLHPSTVHRVVTGERQGRPHTRRKLWEELKRFPVQDVTN